MPRNPVINRRNVTSLHPQKISLSEEAMGILAELGYLLHVSRGSLADMAIKELRALPPRRLAELLQKWGHLTDEEFALVLDVIEEAAPGKPTAKDKEGGS